MIRGLATLVILLAAGGCAVSPYSDEPVVEPEPGGEGEMAPIEDRGSAEYRERALREEHEEGDHFVNLFWGYSWERGDNGPTFGIDYEYRIVPMLGVGAFFDYVAGTTTDISAFGVGAYLHPVEHVTLLVAPGLEWKHDERNALLRVGGFYEIPYKGWTVSPTAYLDFVRGGDRMFILGVSVGTSF